MSLLLRFLGAPPADDGLAAYVVSIDHDIELIELDAGHVETLLQELADDALASVSLSIDHDIAEPDADPGHVEARPIEDDAVLAGIVDLIEDAPEFDFGHVEPGAIEDVVTDDGDQTILVADHDLLAPDEDEGLVEPGLIEDAAAPDDGAQDILLTEYDLDPDAEDFGFADPGIIEEPPVIVEDGAFEVILADHDIEPIEEDLGLAEPGLIDEAEPPQPAAGLSSGVRYIRYSIGRLRKIWGEDEPEIEPPAHTVVVSRPVSMAPEARLRVDTRPLAGQIRQQVALAGRMRAIRQELAVLDEKRRKDEDDAAIALLLE